MKKRFTFLLMISWLTVSVNAQNYCESKGNQPAEEWISAIDFPGGPLLSEKEGYEFFTPGTVILERGSSHPIGITGSFNTNQFDEYFRVWIDFNQDGDFNDNEEKIFEAVANDPTGNSINVNGNFSVPLNARLGDTRMRVAMKREAYAEYCETFEHGEVEDYEIEIIYANSDKTDVNVGLYAPIGATVGETIEIICNVSNSGALTATNLKVKINCYAPFNNLELISWNLDLDAGEYDPLNFEWTVPELRRGSSRSLKIRAKVNSPEIIPLFLQIIASDVEDADSTPGNALPFVATEDDERYDEINALNYNVCHQNYVFNSQFELNGFIPCDVIKGDVILRGATISDLSKFDRVELIEGNLIIENTKITDLSGFSDLRKIDGDFKLVNNPELATVAGAPLLSWLEGLELNNLPKINNLLAFTSVERVDDLTITQLPELIDLKGLENMSIVEGSVDISENPELIDASTFSVSDDGVNVRFANNPKLVNLQAFDGEFFLGELILHNLGIKDVEAFSDVYTVSFLEITENLFLENLDHLVKIQYGWGLRIQDNPLLTNCCGVVNFIERGDLGGNIFINDNLTGCNSQTEIFENCNNGISSFCDSYALHPWQYWTANVNLNTIDNNSEKCHEGSCGYSDFTAISTDLEIGDIYEMKVTPGFSYFQRRRSVMAWIDFNQDNDFLDPGEAIFRSLIPAGTDGAPANIGTEKIRIPENAKLGPTRMRVTNNSYFVSPCHVINSGEVEDYTVKIVDNLPTLESGCFFEAVHTEAIEGSQPFEILFSEEKPNGNYLFTAQIKNGTNDPSPLRQIELSSSGQFLATEEIGEIPNNEYSKVVNEIGYIEIPAGVVLGNSFLLKYKSFAGANIWEKYINIPEAIDLIVRSATESKNGDFLIVATITKVAGDSDAYPVYIRLNSVGEIQEIHLENEAIAINEIGRTLQSAANGYFVEIDKGSYREIKKMDEKFIEIWERFFIMDTKSPRIIIQEDAAENAYFIIESKVSNHTQTVLYKMSATSSLGIWSLTSTSIDGPGVMNNFKLLDDGIIVTYFERAAGSDAQFKLNVQKIDFQKNPIWEFARPWRFGKLALESYDGSLVFIGSEFMNAVGKGINLYALKTTSGGNLSPACAPVNLQLPDILADQVVLPKTINRDGKLIGSFDLVNVGEVSTNESIKVKFYLSKDAVLSPDDHFSDELIFGNILANQTIGNNSFALEAPNFNPGSFFLIMHIDAEEQVQEFREDNNVRSFALTLQGIELPGNYCPINSAFPWHEWISKVSIDDQFQWESGKSDYSDFSEEAPVIMMEKGSAVDFSFDISYSYLTYNAYLALFVDFNRNGIFEEEERSAMAQDPIAQGAGATTTLNRSVIVPEAASIGATKARVIFSRDPILNGCAEIAFGEIEDYQVEILEGSIAPRLSRANPAVNIFPNPVEDILIVDLNELKDVENISIYNSLGHLKYTEDLSHSFSSRLVKIDLSQFVNGTYLLKISGERFKPIGRVVQVQRTY